MPDHPPHPWSNSTTGRVATWINEDVLVVKQWQQFAADVWRATQASQPSDPSAVARENLAAELKRWVVDFNPLAGKASVYADLLDASLSEVSWTEIADDLLSRSDGYLRLGDRQ